MNDPVLVMAPLNIGMNSGQGYYEAAKARYLARYRILSEHLPVKVLCPEKPTRYSYNPYWTTRDLEADIGDGLVQVRCNSEDDQYTMLWPRDAFTCFDSFVCSPYFAYTFYTALAASIWQTNPSCQFLKSDIGEGGLTVREQDILIGSNSIKDDRCLDFVENEGTAVFLLSSEPDYSRLPGREDNNHIDTEFNFVVSEHGVVHFFVNEGFYRQMAEDINYIRLEVGATTLTRIPEKSPDRRFHGVNFINLPDGSVAVADCCPLVRFSLEKMLGKKNVIALPVMPKFDYSGKGGGLRCMTNLVYRYN